MEAQAKMGNTIAQDISESGLVLVANIPGEKYQASNNRGELYTIYKVLQYVSTLPDTPVTIISDSEYSILDWKQIGR